MAVCLVVIVTGAVSFVVYSKTKEPEEEVKPIITQTATYEIMDIQNDLNRMRIVCLEAHENELQTIIETIKIDLSTCELDLQKVMVDVYDRLVQSYDSVDGVNCTGTMTSDVYEMVLSADVSRDVLHAVSIRGNAVVEGMRGNRVSYFGGKAAEIPQRIDGIYQFDVTCESLLNQGYVPKL